MIFLLQIQKTASAQGRRSLLRICVGRSPEIVPMLTQEFSDDGCVEKAEYLRHYDTHCDIGFSGKLLSMPEDEECNSDARTEN